MEQEDSIALTLPAEAGTALLVYMKATKTETIGKFFLEAIKRSLSPEDQDKMTPQSCQAKDNYATRSESNADGDILVTMSFRDAARAIYKAKVSDSEAAGEGSFTWVVHDAHALMDKLAPVLSREQMLRVFETSPILSPYPN